MQRVFRALRTWFRGDRKSVRRSLRLAVELLEERLAPAGDFRSVIGADLVQSQYPYRGTGYTVAILDTGIDYNDTDLGGGIGPGRRVVAGYDFINNDANPMDDNGHGTHLAGIIGSSNPNAPGIAPNVQFVALKVLDANMNGNWTAVDNALKWVIANKARYNIVDVNLSLGSGNYTANPYNLLETDFTALKSLGVFTAVASGNKYFTFSSQPGLSYPSVSPNVVSVGATWAANYSSPATFSTGATESAPTLDHIVSFTQRSSALAILAPGAWITSDWLNNTMQPMGGTSMATAVVSGAATLLHQAYDQTGKSALATQDNILRLMQSTGVTIVDANYGTDNVTHTGLTFKRLNLKAAMDAIGQAFPAPTFAPIANQTLQVGSTITVPLSVSSPTGSPITFTYTQVYLPVLAYQLDQQYGFRYLGNYYQNIRGVNEKWIVGAGGVWYAILPTGAVRRWTGSMTDMMTGVNLIATLDASYYTDPSKLWNAPAANMPPAVFALTGNKLSITGTVNWVGSYSVIVSANDGHFTVKQGFSVTEVPANLPPMLAAINAQTMAKGQTSLAIALPASDADNDALTFQAVAHTPDAALYQLNQQYAFQPASATYYLNLLGSHEKWLIGKNTWYVLMPTGKLYRWSGSMTQTLTAANLIATLDPSVYSEPRLLWNANAPVPPALTYSFQGNQLTIQRPASLTGVFYIDVTVSDGWLTAKRTIQVTLI